MWIRLRTCVRTVRLTATPLFDQSSRDRLELQMPFFMGIRATAPGPVSALKTPDAIHLAAGLGLCIQIG